MTDREPSIEERALAAARLPIVTRGLLTYPIECAARASERAAVVAWLRLQPYGDLAIRAADAIERGEHLKEPKR